MECSRYSGTFQDLICFQAICNIRSLSNFAGRGQCKHELRTPGRVIKVVLQSGGRVCVLVGGGFLSPGCSCSAVFSVRPCFRMGLPLIRKPRPTAIDPLPFPRSFRRRQARARRPARLKGCIMPGSRCMRREITSRRWRSSDPRFRSETISPRLGTPWGSRSRHRVRWTRPSTNIGPPWTPNRNLPRFITIWAWR